MLIPKQKQKLTISFSYWFLIRKPADILDVSRYLRKIFIYLSNPLTCSKKITLLLNCSVIGALRSKYSAVIILIFT